MSGLQIPDKQVKARFPAFGPNKCQEISRLLFEISKREHLKSDAVIDSVPSGCRTYTAVKDHLVKRRFPDACARGEKISESFPAVDIVPKNAMDLSRSERIPAPRHIYLEEGSERSEFVQRLEARFPKAVFSSIRTYKDHAAGIKPDIGSYNRRMDELFVVLEKYDHFKPCPCSGGAVPCGYHNANLGFGCPFECSYCFLQNYTNAPGIVLPANLEDFFDAFGTYAKNVRVGSGETTDSLVYDDLTGFSPRIVEFFQSFPQSMFEFKTKSDNVSGLLGVRASFNIVVGWSVNPQHIIDREERFTAGLAERLDAARRCAVHGYRVAFHFDPVIHEPGWEVSYAKVVADIFKAVPAESIAWISVGTLRMTSAQKKTIENRFPENTILDAELFMAEEGKLRYAHKVRLDIYSKMTAWIRERAHSSTQIYLCMETASIWKDAGMGYYKRF
jgi:spore photoproduct lyase